MTPPTYEELLCEVLPEAIEGEAAYHSVASRLADLVRKGAGRSADETRLMRLLVLVVEDYDRRHGLPPDDSTPAEKLRFLLEASGRGAASLTAVFGQRSHVTEALNGKRPISAEQARKLGALFSVEPGLFI